MKKSLKQPNSKYLVFTSAGENANIPYWLKGHRNFDLWISYYGNEEDKFLDDAEYYAAKKGGKFPNFHHFYHKYYDIISQYDAVLIMDDDLVFSGTDISDLFTLREEYNLWILQPSFDRRGKVSFRMTETHPFSKLRYTNFIEVTCPLFEKDKLAEFMKTYDPILIGWGVDLWYSEIFSMQDISHNKIAVIDDISCINPRDKTKVGQAREIDKLQNTEKRQEVWAGIQQKYNLNTNFKKEEYETIKSAFSLHILLRSLKIKSFRLAYRCYKKITGDNWRPS